MYGQKHTVLDTSISTNNIEITRLLLDNGANLNNPYLLLGAISNGNVNLVKLLIERGMDVNGTDEEQIPPLHTAIEQRRFGIIRLLVENGADVNKLDKYNNSPLWYALTYGEPTIEVKYLLSKGVNPNAPYKVHGKTKTIYDKVLSDNKYAKWILENPDDEEAYNYRDDPHEVIAKTDLLLKLFDATKQGKLQNLLTAAAGTIRGGRRKRTRRFRLKRRKTLKR